MTVRPATGFDEAAALEAWRLALDVRGRPPSKVRQAQVRATLRGPLVLTLVAEHDGCVVGMLLAEPSRCAGVVEPGVLQLSMLYVAPAHQRRGHGTALLEALLARYPAVRAEPTEESVDFFERAGFRPRTDHHVSPALQGS